MENVICAVFKVESEGYQALTELKNSAVSDSLVVSEACLVKKTESGFTLLDSFDLGLETTDDTAIGGMAGAIAGIVLGPMGVLLGASTGMLVGAIVDEGDYFDNAGLIEKVSEQLKEGEVAIIALAQEEEGAFDEKMAAYTDVEVIREDAAEVAEEIRRARKVEAEIAKEARKKLYEERKNACKEDLTAKRENIKEKFNQFKNKMKGANA